MAKVRHACQPDISSTPARTSEQVSRTVVSAASHDSCSCCDRKYASTGYDRWLSSSSDDHSSQSSSSRSTDDSVPFEAERRRSSTDVGGDPAHWSSIEIRTSRREKALYRTGRYAIVSARNPKPAIASIPVRKRPT